MRRFPAGTSNFQIPGGVHVLVWGIKYLKLGGGPCFMSNVVFDNCDYYSVLGVFNGRYAVPQFLVHNFRSFEKKNRPFPHSNGKMGGRGRVGEYKRGGGSKGKTNSGIWKFELRY